MRIGMDEVNFSLEISARLSHPGYETLAHSENITIAGSTMFLQVHRILKGFSGRGLSLWDGLFRAYRGLIGMVGLERIHVWPEWKRISNLGRLVAMMYYS